MSRTHDFTEILCDWVDGRLRQARFANMWLGGGAGPDGGSSYRPIDGQLTQRHICYDTSETASPCSPSGFSSLVDNLRRIRYWQEPATWFGVTTSGTVPSGAALYVYIKPGLWYPSTTEYCAFEGGNSPTFTLPDALDRIDTVYIDASGILHIVQGTPDVSPTITLPSISSGIPLWAVYLTPTSAGITHTVCSGYYAGMGYIERDLRPFLNLGGTTASGVITNHNDLNGIQGGAVDNYYHFTQAQHTSFTVVAEVGSVLVCTGANVWGADLTPLWKGTHTWDSGFAVKPTDAAGQDLGDATHRWDLYTQDVIFGGATGANVITVPDNIADALHVSDAGGLEYWRIVSTNANPYFLIDPAVAGIKVGIGTAVPPNLLTVAGTVRWGGVVAPFAISSIDGGGLFIEQTGTTTANEDIRIQTSKSGDLVNYAQFFIDPTDGFSFMGIGTGNYNVCIGAAVAAAYLDINVGATTYALYVRGGTIAGANGSIRFDGGATSCHWYIGATEDIYLRSGQTTGNVILQDTGGDVGVGCVPAVKLDVNGHTRTLSLAIQGGGTAEAGSLFSNANYGMLFIAKQAGPAIAQFSWYDSTIVTNYMTIGPTGLVGLGLTAPVTLLHLHTGASLETIMRFTNATTGVTVNDGLEVGIDAAEGAYLWNREATEMYFGTSNIRRVTILAGGNFGVGIAAPAHKVDVNAGATADDGIRIYGSANDVILQIYNTAAGGTDWCLDSTSNASGYGGGNLVFVSGGATPGAGAAKVLFQNGGNVGIGTITPGSNLPGGGSRAADRVLHLHGTANTHVIVHGSSPHVEFYDSDAAGVANQRITHLRHNAEKFRIASLTDALNTSQIFLCGDASNGYVGIGTESPRGTLDVAGHVIVGAHNGSDVLIIERYDAGTAYCVIRAGHADNNVPVGFMFQVRDAAGVATDSVHFKSTGVIQFLIGYGAAAVQSDAAGNLSTPSDRRYKTQVRDTNVGLAAVLQLRGKRWHYTKESGLETEHEYQGFIAGDVEKAVPGAVSMSNTGFRVLNYNAILPAFAQAIREIDTRLAKLELAQ